MLPDPFHPSFQIPDSLFRVFLVDHLSQTARSRNMQAIRSRGTSIEKKLGTVLWAAGYRYRKHAGRLPGKPDFIFTKYRTAVFCDGEFWHGKNWSEDTPVTGSNTAFWQEKIKRNRLRDQQVNAELQSAGWKVLRFWGSDIMRHSASCLVYFEHVIRSNMPPGVYRFNVEQLLKAAEAETPYAD